MVAFGGRLPLSHLPNKKTLPPALRTRYKRITLFVHMHSETFAIDDGCIVLAPHPAAAAAPPQLSPPPPAAQPAMPLELPSPTAAEEALEAAFVASLSARVVSQGGRINVAQLPNDSLPAALRTRYTRFQNFLQAHSATFSVVNRFVVLASQPATVPLISGQLNPSLAPPPVSQQSLPPPVPSAGEDAEAAFVASVSALVAAQGGRLKLKNLQGSLPAAVHSRYKRIRPFLRAHPEAFAIDNGFLVLASPLATPMPPLPPPPPQAPPPPPVLSRELREVDAARAALTSNGSWLDVVALRARLGHGRGYSEALAAYDRLLRGIDSCVAASLAASSLVTLHDLEQGVLSCVRELRRLPRVLLTQGWVFLRATRDCSAPRYGLAGGACRKPCCALAYVQPSLALRCSPSC